MEVRACGLGLSFVIFLAVTVIIFVVLALVDTLLSFILVFLPLLLQLVDRRLVLILLFVGELLRFDFSVGFFDFCFLDQVCFDFLGYLLNEGFVS